MRKPLIFVALLTTLALVGCNGSKEPAEESKGGEETSEVAPTTSEEAPASSEAAPTTSEEAFDPSTLPTNGIALQDGQKVRFEAENAKPTDWKNSGWGGDATFVADDADANASGGKFVTPSTGNYSASRKFEIVFYAPKAGTVTMAVAYCRGGKNSKTATIDYSYVYQYRLADENVSFTCATANHTDNSVASWDWREITFTFSVDKGLHTLEGFLDSQNANTNAGCPCIDYFDFTI